MASILCPKLALLAAICAVLVSLPSRVLATFPFYFQLPLPSGTAGSVDIVFNFQNDGPFTGISDGTVVVFNPLSFGFVQFATVVPNRDQTLCNGKNDPALYIQCGRPVSLGFNQSNYLYIGDANLGLFVVGPNGGLATPLISTVDGLPIGSLFGLDVDPNNELVYFTSFSQIYRLNNLSLAIGSGDRTGRLIRYDPATGTATTLLRNLAGPSGVAVCADSSCVIYVEKLSNTVSKLYLTGPNAGTVTVLLTNVINPDIINRSPSVGTNFFLSENIQPFVQYALRIDVNGNILKNISIDGPYNSVMDVTGVTQFFALDFYFGSLTATFVGKAIFYAL
ncbi:hypothetical protein MLD38_039338 [Melastoma candidum]|uniref:Uncharacterized protein n=1 Tax=Melastoma candidum TaxID=119954 RepID=A0ACB9L2Z4_9MYRT|nr:hypothetical protein MLD38_039338 [Melastoma candidum]